MLLCLGLHTVICRTWCWSSSRWKRSSCCIRCSWCTCSNGSRNVHSYRNKTWR